MSLEPKSEKKFGQRLRDFYLQNERKLEVAVFLGGFFFDIFTLGRVDDTFNIIQQFVYLVFLLTLILLEVRFDVLKVSPPPWLAKVWVYRNLIIHFFLGSLLSVYTLFYFKSASMLSTFTFVLLIAVLMVLNELPFVQNIGLKIRVILWNLCLASFLAIHTPTLMGFIGWLPFTLAMVFGAAIAVLIHKHLLKQKDSNQELKKSFLIPAVGTYAVFFLLYVLKLVPPVPLSLEYLGIYHRVEKKSDVYELFYDRPYWKFWENGAQTFLYQAGDKIHCFVQIFAPTGLKEKINLKWFHDDPKKGWAHWDTIPLPISGGRDSGYRGYGVKSNFTPGNWLVVVETSDGREVGRIHFEVVPEDPSQLRKFEIDQR